MRASPKNIYRNHFIQVKLPTVEDIVEGIRRAKLCYPGQKLVGYKLDLSKYYRFLPTCPRDWPVQCIKWKNQVYMDTSWSFGLRSAVQAAQRTSSAVRWMFRENVSDTVHVVRNILNIDKSVPDEIIVEMMKKEEIWNYIDDFIGISTEKLAPYQWERLQNLVISLGLKVSETPGHLVPPTECFTGLGIEFNIPLNLRRIPTEKLKKAKALLAEWKEKTDASKLELQQLLGLLNHLSGCISPGRLFVSRMLTDLRHSYKIEPEKVKLSYGFKKDLEWWRQSLDNNNGISILDHQRRTIQITMDGSTKGEVGDKPGIGAYNFDNHEYFHSPIPDWLPPLDIADYELLVHVIAAVVWGPSWRGLEIDGYTDNQATQHLINHGRSSSQFRLSLAREFAWLQTQFDFRWNSLYINTKNNILSDALSRWGDPKQQERFHELTKGYNSTEIFIPESFFKFKFHT